MKVNIQYSIELEEIPGKVRDFLAKAAEKSVAVEPGIRYTISLLDSVSSIDAQLRRIDKVRRDMADIDLILLDCSEILHGYQKAMVQLREPQLPTNLIEDNHDDETRNEEVEEG